MLRSTPVREHQRLIVATTYIRRSSDFARTAFKAGELHCLTLVRECRTGPARGLVLLLA
jgi:hypothetical protein